MKRGLSFEITNGYGSYLGEILKPIDITAMDWYIGGEEAYFDENGSLGKPLFAEKFMGWTAYFSKALLKISIMSFLLI